MDCHPPPWAQGLHLSSAMGLWPPPRSAGLQPHLPTDPTNDDLWADFLAWFWTCPILIDLWKALDLGLPFLHPHPSTCPTPFLGWWDCWWGPCPASPGASLDSLESLERYWSLGSSWPSLCSGTSLVLITFWGGSSLLSLTTQMLKYRQLGTRHLTLSHGDKYFWGSQFSLFL